MECNFTCNVFFWGGGVGVIGTVGSILKNSTATTFCSQNPTTSRMPVAKAPRCRRCAAEASLLPISVGRCLEAGRGLLVMAVNFQQPKGTLGHEIHLSWENLFVHDTAVFSVLFAP